MQTDNAIIRKLMSRDLMDVMIRIGIIAIVIVMCARIIAPFAGLMLWALILAVALYPLHYRLAKRLGDRQGHAAILLVVAGLLVIGLPTVMLGSSFAGYVHEAFTVFRDKPITIKQPDAAIADWPLIGETVYNTWSSAATDLPAFLEGKKPQLEKLSKRVLSAAASTAGGVFVFLGALVVAGIIMTYGESGNQTTQRILNRLAGPAKGPQLHRLSTATIRSVAMGVIGVAFIQALLLGVGFILAGIPAAGLLALIVLLIGILQLPALLVSVPVIAYLWWSGDTSTTHDIVWTIYLLMAGMADNVLKPLLVGRGVDAPMPVILLGALGGMVSGGFVGLFVGAVLLAVGYQIFMGWVDQAEESTNPESGQTETAAPVSPVSE